jgi:hypothetical protein
MTQKSQPRPRIGAVGSGFDQKDLSESVEKLLSDLDAAFGGVEGALSKSLPPIVDQRAQCAAALRTVERFLLDVDWVHAERFAVLAEAIEDLNIGAQHPLLVPIKKTARPLPSQIWGARAVVVCAIEFLSMAGVKPEDAVKKILHDFPAIENLARSDRRRDTKAGLIKAILEWRKTVHAPSRNKPKVVIEVLPNHEEFLDLEWSGEPNWDDAMADKCLKYADKIARSGLASTSAK